MDDFGRILGQFITALVWSCGVLLVIVVVLASLILAGVL
jgi:hypothetical protein